eukprot:jgi/Undpi1/296/HiC_scaffold_1.g00292.m1
MKISWCNRQASTAMGFPLFSFISNKSTFGSTETYSVRRLSTTEGYRSWSTYDVGGNIVVDEDANGIWEGSALDDDNSAGLTLNAEECVKFVGLCYFIKSRKLFTNATGCSHLCQWHLIYQQDHDCRLVERSGTYLQTIDAGGGGTAVGALGSGRDRVRGIQQSSGGGRGVAQCKGVDEGSEFSEVFGLFDEESDHNSDGDDGALPGLSAFSDHLRDASAFSDADTAEYIHALQSEAGGEPLRFTMRDESSGIVGTSLPVAEKDAPAQNN